MFVLPRSIAILLILFTLGAGCAPAPPRDVADNVSSSVPIPGATIKRITLGTTYEQDVRPTTLANAARIVVPLVHAGLTVLGDQRLRRPVLAEAVPSLENGLWAVLPGGRMETTWRLREGVRWHDGAPLTADDLLFTFEVGRDREMSVFNAQAYASIEEVRAPDPRTLTITWKEPFIEADALLDLQPLGPLPRHRLEEAYRSDKASLVDLPYWVSDFVGAGPYRLRESVPGVGMLLEANSDYVLGRPRIDQIEVTYIPDANTLMANVLGGAVDLTNNLGSVDLGIQVRDQWREGVVRFNYGSDAWVVLVPQFIDPRPSALADVEVRRALAHAIDRQEIVDTLVAGMAPLAHSILSPNQAAYRDIEAALPRYDYDPRRAAQMLEGRGYRRGADGVYRDAEDRRLELEVNSQPLQQAAKPAVAVADYWQRFGVATTLAPYSIQQSLDLELISTFAAFAVWTRPADVGGLRQLHSSLTRLPSNNFRVPGVGNTSRYMNPEFDTLLDTYFRTVPMPERTQALGQIIRHMADQVTTLGLYHFPAAGAVSDRVQNVSREWPGPYITWNAHEWDLRS